MPSLPPWPFLLGLTLLRVALVWALFFVAFPVLVLPRTPEEGSEAIVARSVVMIYFTIALTHMLALTRLYEGLTILALCVGAVGWRFYFSRQHGERAALLGSTTIWILDTIDRMTGRSTRQATALPFSPTLPETRFRFSTLITLGTVLAVAAWMRFDQAFRHAAPAYSDAPVTLFWMKTLDVARAYPWGGLYPDGVYPKGMYAVLTLLKKLTLSSGTLLMEAVGPLVGFLLVVTVALFVRWITQNNIAAAAAALVYGTLPGAIAVAGVKYIPGLLPYEVARHTGYNSQEFGLLLPLPAAWFTYRYLTTGERWYLWAAAAAAGSTTFIHVVPPLEAASLMGAALVAAVLVRQAPWGRIWRLAVWCAGAVTTAIIPLILGLTVMKQGWHGTSEEFLANALPPWPAPRLWPFYVAVALAAVAPLLARAVNRQETGQALFGALTVGAGFLVWYGPWLFAWLPGVGAFAERTGHAGAVALGISAGMAWHSITLALPLLRKRLWVQAVAFAALAGTTWYYLPPEPLLAPRIATDEIVEQVIRVDRNFRSGEWLIILDDKIGPPMALNRGQHQWSRDFLAHARVTPSRWCWEEDGKLTAQPPNVALFVDKQNAGSVPLSTWIDQQRTRLPMTRTYASPKLEVWLLIYPKDPGEANDILWGRSTGTECNLSAGEKR